MGAAAGAPGATNACPGDGTAEGAGPPGIDPGMGPATDAGIAPGLGGAAGIAALEGGNAPITCVRSLGRGTAGAPEAAGAADGVGPLAAGFATLGMICVPGMPRDFFVGLGSGGDDGDCACARSAAATAAPAAASNAPRCETTLLTASGETCEASGAEGIEPDGAGAGGGPYGAGPMLLGDAVCAKGFTELGPAPYGAVLPGGMLGSEPAAGGAPPGARGSPAGAPHAAQNFREPMSSAPHFAQWVMGPCMLGQAARRHK